MGKIFGITSSKIKIFIFSVLTGLVGTLLLVYFESMSALGYSIMLVVFAVAVLGFFPKQKRISRVSCLLSFNMHMMVARAIVSAAASIITGHSIFDLSHDPTCFWIILILTTIISTLISTVTLKFVPIKYLSQLSSNTEYLYFYIIIAGLANVYMIMNGNVYIHNIQYKWLSIHQIIASLTWFSATYVVAIMFGISNITRERKKILERDSIYKHLVESRSLAVIKVNCTQDTVLRIMFNGKKQPLPEMPYSEYSLSLLKECMLEENFEKIAIKESPENLIQEYHDGNTLIEFTMQANIWGKLRWVKTSITITKDASNEDILAVISTTDDIHESKEKEKELLKEAEKDPLSHLYNKKATEHHIKEHLRLHKTGSLFMIDLDNFKAINDNFGHAYGDDVIKEVSDKLIHSFRSDDIIGRVGGDEFIIFYKNGTDREKLELRAKQLLRFIKQEYSKDGVTIEISSSIGIAIADNELSFQDLYQMADVAMYKCKKGSKDGFVIYEDDEFL